MSVLAVTEQIGLEGHHSFQTTGRLARQYVRKFKVYCSVPNETANTALLAATIPVILASYPGDAFSRCIDKKASQTQSDPKVWDVVCSYDSQFQFDPLDWTESPLTRPPIWEFSWEKGEKFVRADLDDVEIANSAKSPILPPLSIDYGIPIITVSRNVSTFSYASVATLQECVNSDTWNGFAPGVVKIRGISVKSIHEESLNYFSKTWTLAINWQKWRPHKVLDEGYYELAFGGQTLFRSGGVPLPSPTLLDGAGKKLPTGDPPFYLEFMLNREVAFSGVPIP